MRLVPPLAVRTLSACAPRELLRVQMQGNRPTLAIVAADGNGKPQLVCLDVAQAAQSALPPPVFVPVQSSGNRPALCLGTDYAFVPNDLADIQAYPDTGGSLNGAMLIGPSGAFLQVHGKIGGFTETRYFDVSKGTLLGSVPDPQATFSISAWTIRWTDAEVSRHVANPLFSFP